MHLLDTEELISPRTPHPRGRDRPGPTRTVRHRQGLSFSSLVAVDREGPDAFSAP